MGSNDALRDREMLEKIERHLIERDQKIHGFLLNMQKKLDRSRRGASLMSSIALIVGLTGIAIATKTHWLLILCLYLDVIVTASAFVILVYWAVQDVLEKRVTV